MSVISSRRRGRAPSSSTPSILKKPRSLKSRLSEVKTSVKVKFMLPHSQKVHSILEEYKDGTISRDYENLLCLIRDAELTDEDVSSLLKEATECISILNQDLRLFVEALLSIDWTGKSREVVAEYHSFVVNLLSAHNYHSKLVVEKLVTLFVPNATDVDWPDGVPTDADYRKCVNVHTLLNLLLSVVPMCKEILINFLTKKFPYYNKSTHIHEYYLHNLLWTLDYQPGFRQDILYLVISKLVILDVSASKEMIAKCTAEEEIFPMDDDSRSVRTCTTSTTSTIANSYALSNTLDVCMDKLFNYIIAECHSSEDGELIWDKAKALYLDLITVFDKVVLPTYDPQHVQFVMFLMCCLKPTIAEAFLNYLWKKMCNPNVARVIRRAAVNYIASLLARANFVPLSMLKGTLQQMAEWIHSYISNQDALESVNYDLRVHSVFYSVCQALFYVVSFRYKDLVRSKKNIIFLQSLNMAKMVTCRLNPLRVCQPAIVQNFAAITRNYQLAYCYTIIEHNARDKLPVIYDDDYNETTRDVTLDTYYPFDPYVLERSGKKIQPFYRDYEESPQDSMEVDETVSNQEEDDFLCNQELSSTPNSKINKFSYGSSPGFRFKT
ncbi:hypothetical protein NQ315_011705 [Exocentrus adspersus]|uniref:RNA polymerase I-specific transcription initiation factor RRN3 n=1 Tax=Exocentrus adspersus TaxID=1586481 RepID=A0AAV8W1D0_9CUCU|nr:hypothetical protein NQ315_011705 [Exocentrus adspersus]